MPLTEQFEYANDYVRNNITPLSAGQLNWKPSPHTWSIAQCLDHLIVNNNNYFKTFDALVDNTYKSTFWQRSSPFTNCFEKKLLEFTAPVAQKKVKAPPSFSPSKTFIDKDVILHFLQQQQKLLEYYYTLEPMANSKKIIISSPFSNLITINLKILLLAIADHEQRHISQADRVLHHPQFPKA